MISSLKVAVMFVAMLAQLCAAIKPTHIILGYSGDPTNMKVSYMTTAKVLTTPLIYWWEEPAHAQHIVNVTADGTTATFTLPNSLGTQYITTAFMGRYTKLKPGASYTYQIRLNNADSSTWSAVYDFKGLPALNTPITVGIFGDLGSQGPILTSTNAYGLKAYAQNHQFDMIVHNGDLAYNLGAQSGLVGESFMTNLQDVSARVPYHVSPGNHEYWTSDNSLQYYQGWWQGQKSLGTLSKSTQPLLWYSFNVSYAHFVVINTEVYCEDTSKIAEMYNWLKADLADYRAKSPTGWIFAVGHRQMYLGTTGAFDSYLQRYGLNCTNPTLFSTCNPKKPCYQANSAQCGFAIEPLFFQYKVDFSFEGHQHLYHRYFPIGPNNRYETQTPATYVNPQYPIHIISGAAGMDSEGFRNVRAIEQAMASPHVAFASTSSSIESFTVTKIYNTTHVQFQQISCNTATPGVQDSFWVVKDSTKGNAATATFTVTSTGATGCQ